MRSEFIGWQVTFEAMSFDSVGIEYKHRWCPNCVETMEVNRVLFDVCAKRNEIVVDECSGFVVAV